MSQPFEATEEGKVRIVEAIIRDNAPVRWRVTISGASKYHALGFTLEHARYAK
jgi:hypothetical protein